MTISIVNKYRIILILLILLLSCNNSDKQVTDTKLKKEFPDQEGWNQTLRATKNGQLSAIIKYGYMERYNKKKIVNFSNGVTVDFFDEEGNHTSQLTSDNGRLDENTNNIEAFGNVVVISDTGITLQTQKIWWDNAIEKIVSDQFVTITTAENDTVYGTGFVSDQTLSQWEIKKGSAKTNRSIDLNIKNNNRAKKESTQINNESKG